MLEREARVPGLDAVRAVAIAMVVGWHFAPLDLLPEATVNRLAVLSRGVDLFFVLSGYLIGGIVLREVAPAGAWLAAVSRFWRRRWYRTLPAYLATVALYVITLAFPHQASAEGFPWLYLVFLQSYVLGLPQVFGHSWTLAVEEHFYLALPLLVIGCGAAHRRTPARVAAVVGGVGLVLAAARVALRLAGHDVNEALSHWRADGLVAGVLLACATHGGDRLVSWLAARRAVSWIATITLVAAAFVLDLRGSLATPTALAVAFAALVALAASGEPLLARVGAARPVATVARLSYAVYLTHQLANRSLQVVVFDGGPRDAVEVAAHVPLALALTGVSAWLLHRVVERPFLRLRERRAPALRATPPPR